MTRKGVASGAGGWRHKMGTEATVSPEVPEAGWVTAVPVLFRSGWVS